MMTELPWTTDLYPGTGSITPAMYSSQTNSIWVPEAISEHLIFLGKHGPPISIVVISTIV